MELCNKKRDDGIWMDEVAALQAYSPSEFSYVGRSGITLAAEQTDDTLSHGSLDTTQGDILILHTCIVLLLVVS